jgi:RND family efflux transporter MFP subunit
MKIMNMKTNKLSLLIITVFATSMLYSCSGNQSEQKNISKENPVEVTVSTPGNEDLSGGINASGQVEAIQSANISTRVMGYITNVYVKIGDKVKQGQLLFTVNSSDILAKRAQTDAMIAQADAALTNAKKDYERFSALYKQQSATAKELDNASLQYFAAKANANAAKQMRNEVNAQLSYTNVTAPFSGVVTQKMLDAGSMATPGMPVITLEQSGSLQVSTSVSESQIGTIKQGDDAIVNIKSINKIIPGKITQISQSSQSSGGQYIIKISIPGNEKQVYAGMYVNVNIPEKGLVQTAAIDENNILVPVESIINKDQLTGLYTIGNNNTALLRWVRLGKNYGNKVEVLSGLAKNETFIVHADGRLYNGVPVTVK